jgi:hypothetical protein
MSSSTRNTTPTSAKASSTSRSRTSSPSLHNTSHPKVYTTSQLRYSASVRYGLYSSRTRSTWKRCPHLLRLSPLSKAPPESNDHARRAESIEYGRASSTWARLIAKIYGDDPQGGSRFARNGESPFICARCGNSMRVLAIITEPSQIDRILRHLIKIGRAPPGLILAPLH